jgi:hypothetical protein
MRVEAFVRGHIALKSLEKVRCLMYAMSDSILGMVEGAC